KVEPVKMNEALMLNVNAAATVGIVTSLKKNNVACKLKVPVCAEIKSRVTISRRIGNRFRLIGYGEILEGKTTN
ncbi:MAG: translation initiation factor IF-2 subunit gamma, partial [Nanoarchaeota archaeon]